MQSNKSNLIYFFLFLLCNTFFCSCSSDSSNNNHPVPDVYFDVEIDLKYYNELTNNSVIYLDHVGDKQLGYNQNGIFIFRGGNNQFFAYDATCPLDIESDQHVKLNDSKDSKKWHNGATCPVCKSEFYIPNGAFPVKDSKAKHSLKQYRTSKNGNILRIYNR